MLFEGRDYAFGINPTAENSSDVAFKFCFHCLKGGICTSHCINNQQLLQCRNINLNNNAIFGAKNFFKGKSVGIWKPETLKKIKTENRMYEIQTLGEKTKTLSGDYE